MMNERQSALYSSFITRHSPLPLQLQAQPVNLLQVVGLAPRGLGVARVDAARDARAVEGQLAGRAVEARAREPARGPAPQQRAVGRAGAAAHRAQALVFG